MSFILCHLSVNNAKLKGINVKFKHERVNVGAKLLKFVVLNVIFAFWFDCAKFQN